MNDDNPFGLTTSEIIDGLAEDLQILSTENRILHRELKATGIYYKKNGKMSRLSIE